MRLLRTLGIVLVPIALALSGCSATVLPSGGVKVSGSIFFDPNMTAISPATITIQQGSDTYAVSVVVPAPGQTGQTGTFTISGVPAGTCNVVAAFTTDFNSQSIGINYTMTGSSSSPTIDLVGPVSNDPNWDWTATMNGIVIQSDTDINFDVQAVFL